MISELLSSAVAGALRSLGVDDVPAGVTMERPANPDHGDWSTNAALVCQKIVGKNPRQFGQELLDALQADTPQYVVKMEIAGPGFVNFFLDNSYLQSILKQVVDAGQDGFGQLNIGEGKRVNVEFVSANPTGPIHAGGGRWGAYGDSLARIMTRCGYETHREYYINDRGVQTQIFGQSLTARKTGEEIPENGYAGQYIVDWAAEMPDDVDPIEWGIERSLEDARETLESMQVHFDTWSSEKALVEAGLMEQTMVDLRESGYVYDEDEATWLRTSDFGDDQDRVLIKSDGEPTYFLPDIAYHRDKYDRGDLLIDVLGADHHGYVPRMRAALQILGYKPEQYEAVIGQNVKLMRDGAEVKLSKRTGTMIEIRELVDEVGPDVARLAYLLQSVDTPQTIDIDVLKANAAENPVFYVQYANARIHSLNRTAMERELTRVPLDEVDVSVLNDERELAVLKELSRFDEVVAAACANRAPHQVTTWARELARVFHGFYHHNKILAEDVDPAVAQARWWLAEATGVGLAVALDLLGVRAPERM